jgi:gas vesicle protein
MSDRGSEFPAFFLGVLFGGLVGAVVAILFAPQSGVETRHLIRDKSIELKDQASDYAQQVGQRAGEYAQAAGQKAQEMGQKGQILIEEQTAKVTGKAKAT